MSKLLWFVLTTLCSAMFAMEQQDNADLRRSEVGEYKLSSNTYNRPQFRRRLEDSDESDDDSSITVSTTSTTTTTTSTSSPSNSTTSTTSTTSSDSDSADSVDGASSGITDSSSDDDNEIATDATSSDSDSESDSYSNSSSSDESSDDSSDDTTSSTTTTTSAATTTTTTSAVPTTTLAATTTATTSAAISPAVVGAEGDVVETQAIGPDGLPVSGATNAGRGSYAGQHQLNVNDKDDGEPLIGLYVMMPMVIIFGILGGLYYVHRKRRMRTHKKINTIDINDLENIAQELEFEGLDMEEIETALPQEMEDIVPEESDHDEAVLPVTTNCLHTA